MVVSEKVGSALENARQRMSVLEKNVNAAEKRALKTIEQVRGKLGEAPARLRTVFESTAESLRRRMSFATRAELAEISARVDELSKRVDALTKKRSKVS